MGHSPSPDPSSPVNTGSAGRSFQAVIAPHPHRSRQAWAGGSLLARSAAPPDSCLSWSSGGSRPGCLMAHASSGQPARFKVLGYTQDAEHEAPAHSKHIVPTGQTAMILRPQPAKNGPDLYLGYSKALPQEFWSGPASVMSQRCLSWYLGRKEMFFSLEQEAHLEII